MSRKKALLAITPQMREAIAMAIEGQSCPAIAKKLNVHPTTVRRWFDKEEVLAELADMLKKQTIMEVAKAHKNIQHDLMNDNKDQAYLRQNASFFVINRYEKEIVGDSENTFKITFVNGKPDIGMPDSTDDEEDID